MGGIECGDNGSQLLCSDGLIDAHMSIFFLRPAAPPSRPDPASRSTAQDIRAHAPAHGAVTHKARGPPRAGAAEGA